MIAVDPDGLIRSWNAGARRIFGYGRQEMLGSPLSRLFPAQDQRRMSRLLSRIRRHPWIEYREKSCVTKGARRIDVAFAAIPEQSLFPDREGILLVVHDITARKEIERAVVERFESTERLARVGSWEMNVATGTLVWSEEFCDLLGLAPSLRQSTLRRHLLRVRPGDRKSFIGAIRKTLRDHAPFESRHGLRRDDGSVLEVLSRGRLISGPGPLKRIVGITQDLRDTPEGLVPVLEAHFRKTKSVQRHALLLSRAALALFSGFDHEEALLRTVKTVVPGLADRCIIDLIEKKERVLRFRASKMGRGRRTLPAWVERMELRRFPPGPTARVLRTGNYELHESVSSRELPVLVPDRSALALHPEALPSSLLLVPLHSRRGPMGVVTLVQSESKRHFDASDLLTAQRLAHLLSLAIERDRLHANILGKMEAARRKSQELAQLNRTLEDRVKGRTSELKESLDELEGFARTVAHDLRAPLRGISGFAEALVEDVGERLGPEARTLASRIRACCGRMDALIRDVLALSQASHLGITLEPLELGAIVEMAQRHLAADLVARRAKISIPAPLPRVMGHAGLLSQAVANLLDNATKFVAPGTIPLIRISSQRLGDHVRLQIEDNGIGIAPEDADRIFKAFERLNAGPDFPGTGLGLATVRRSVERMGGTVGMETRSAGGSLFYIELLSAASTNGCSSTRGEESVP